MASTVDSIAPAAGGAGALPAVAAAKEAEAPLEEVEIPEKGTGVDEHGVVNESPAIRFTGLRRLRARMREHIETEREEVVTSLRGPPADPTAKPQKGAPPVEDRFSAASVDALFAEYYPRQDDVFLLAFLRCKKYRVNDAFATLRNFCNFWHLNPKVRRDPRSEQSPPPSFARTPRLFGCDDAQFRVDLSAENVRATYELAFLRILPENARDRNGNRLVGIFPARFSADVFDPMQSLRLSLYTFMATVNDEEMQRRSYVAGGRCGGLGARRPHSASSSSIRSRAHRPLSFTVRRVAPAAGCTWRRSRTCRCGR